MSRSQRAVWLLAAGLGALLAALLVPLVDWLGSDRAPSPLPQTGDDATQAPAEVHAAAAEPPPAAAPPRELVPIDWTGRSGERAPHAPLEAGMPAYRGQLVVGAAHRPLAHAPLRLAHAWLDTVLPRPRSRAEAGDDEDVLAWRGATNALGYFELPLVPSRRDLILMVDPDGPMAELRMLRHGEWPGRTVDLGRIVLDERGAIRGTVRAQGEPVAQARVRALDVPLASATMPEADRERALRGADLVNRERRWSTAGTLVPVPNRLLRRDRVLPFPETTTDAEGAFALPSVRPGRIRLLVQGRAGADARIVARIDAGADAGAEARADPAADAWVDVLVEPGRTTVVEVALDAELGPPTELRFEHGDGAPAEVAAVAVPERLDGLAVQDVAPPRRTEEGRLMVPLRVLEHGSVLVQRHADWPWETYLPKRRRDEWVVVLQQLRAMRIAVSRAGGGAIQDAEVELLPPEPELGAAASPLAAALQPTPTGQPGEWRTVPLPPASYRVLARAPDYAPGLAPGALEPSVVELHLLPIFAMTLRVVGDDGAPLPGALVRALPHNPDPRNASLPGAAWDKLAHAPIVVGRTGPRGELAAAGFWDNSLSLEATHPSGQRALAVVAEPRPGAVVELRAAFPGHLAGRFTDGGAPPAQALVARVEPSRELRRALQANRFLVPATARLDSEGRFALQDLTAGPWLLSVRRPLEVGPAPLWQREVWVRAGITDYIDFELRTPGSSARIRGRVRVNGLVPDDIVAVLRGVAGEEPDHLRDLRRLAARGERTAERGERDAERRQFHRQVLRRVLASRPPPFHDVARLDQDGRFAFHASPEGPLELSLQRQTAGRADVLAAFPIPAGARELEPFDVDLATGTTRVAVLSASGPVRGRCFRAALVGANPPIQYEVVTDAAGELELSAVPAGVYRIRSAAAPESAPLLECEVRAGELRSERVVLE